MEQFFTQTSTPIIPAGKQLTLADLLNQKAALVVAHPGHELCVHTWLTLARPMVFVLTDGSGRNGVPRLGSTARNLAEAGARVGGWFGRYTDRLIYQALLQCDIDFFRGLASELTDELRAANVDYVVGDALEGYNPTHDVCRMLINASLTLLNEERPERPIRNFEFPIIGDNLSEGSITLRLDEVSFGRKTAAMRASPELADEVSVGLDGAVLQKLGGLGDFGDEIKRLITSRGGADFFRQECFRPVVNNHNGGAPFKTHLASQTAQKPYYERYAELLVSAGHYQQVIRYVDHVAPVARALRDVTQRRAVGSGQ